MTCDHHFLRTYRQYNKGSLPKHNIPVRGEKNYWHTLTIKRSYYFTIRYTPQYQGNKSYWMKWGGAYYNMNIIHQWQIVYTYIGWIIYYSFSLTSTNTYSFHQTWVNSGLRPILSKLKRVIAKIENIIWKNSKKKHNKLTQP